MLLAAGRGERMGELTARRPKPLISLGTETLIERHLRRLAEAGIDEVVVNLSYRGDLIRRAVGETTPWGQQVAYSEEGEPPLETAGGIVRALPLLGTEPFLVVSADVVTAFDFARLTEGPERSRLVMVPNPPHHPSGDFGLSAGGRVTREPPLWTYGGIARLDPALFERLDPGARPLRPVFDAAIHRGLLRGLLFEGLWEDVGTPERLAAARETLASASSHR